MDERKHERVAWKAPVRIHFSGPEEFMESFGRDLSLGGIAFVSNTEIPVGTQLRLTVRLGDKGQFDVKAVIVWSKAPGSGRPGAAGARFVQLPDKVRSWIEGEIKRRRLSPASSAAGEDRHLLRRAEGARSLSHAEDRIAAMTSADAILGIDLGTSNTCACLYRDGHASMLSFSEPELGTQDRKLPSVVSFLETGDLIGEPAKRQRDKHPQRTVHGSKRLVGRRYDSLAVQEMLSRFPYRIVKGAGEKTAIEIEGRKLSLTSVAARILKRVKAEASKQLKVPITKVVITVPAYYNDNQRQAVVDAGRLAGLEVVRILNEPTAAAIAYGLTQSKPRRLVVYDLGGGTFDVSIMSVHKDALVVRATAGDTFLGGEDFDHAIVEHVYAVYRERGVALSTNLVTRSQIKMAAERAKQSLTTRDKAMVTVRSVKTVDRREVRIEFELTREELVRLTKKLVTRTLKITAMALREAGLSREDVSDVILVGGQARMPYIRDQVREAFKCEPRMDLDPDEVVAMGAGLLPTLDPASNRFVDVLSMGIGYTMRGEYEPVFERNTPLPVNKHSVVKVAPNQFEHFAVDIYQGDDPKLIYKEHLGTLRPGELRPGSENPIRLRIDFALSEECLLAVRLTNLETMESERLVLHTRDAL